MKLWIAPKGFSLVELMIVVVIVAILVAMGLPSYQRWVLKSNRTEAQQKMLQYANNQEIWRANNTAYDNNSALSLPTDADGNYTFSVSGVDATGYTLSATAQGTQLKDKEGTTTCSPLTLNQASVKGPPVCWAR